MKVQQWTKVAESDTSPMQASTAEGGQSKGLIKTLVAHGIQASASGGWTANKTHQDHDFTDSLIDQLAIKTIAEDLTIVVSTLFLGEKELMQQLDMTDSKVKAVATLVDAIVAEVGSCKGCQLLLDRCRVLMNSSVQGVAKSGAGPPIKKAKKPKARHHPHNNPKG